MNSVLMYAIMGLVCRLKPPGGGFRNLKFDLFYKYIYSHKASISDRLGISQKLIHFNSCLLQKNPGFQKNEGMPKECRFRCKFELAGPKRPV